MSVFGIYIDKLFIVVGGLLLLLVGIWLAVRIDRFREELYYIEHEIDQADGAERDVWLERRRRLISSLNPFKKKR